MISLLLPLLLSGPFQDDEARSRVIIQLEMLKLQQQLAPKIKMIVIVPKQRTFADACAEAIKTGQPLVVFIGQQVLTGGDWVAWRAPLPWVMYDGDGDEWTWREKTVVIHVPENGSIYRIARLHPSAATGRGINNALAPWREEQRRLKNQGR